LATRAAICSPSPWTMLLTSIPDGFPKVPKGTPDALSP